MAEHKELVLQLDKLEQRLADHDDRIIQLVRVVRQLATPGTPLPEAANWISKVTRAPAMRCGRRTASIMQAAVQGAPGAIESRFAAEPFCSTLLQAGQAV